MKKIADFTKYALSGGFLVVLPSAILIGAIKWLFEFITDYLEPLSHLIRGAATDTETSGFSDFLVRLIALLLILVICFFLGLAVSGGIGKWIYEFIEGRVLSKFPGYMLVKESLAQFLGNKKSPFSRVGLVDVFNNDTLMTAFITDEYADGSMTVFVPTAPNPTNGMVYHLQAHQVEILDIPVQEAMRSIISCGAGSAKLIEHPDRQTK